MNMEVFVGVVLVNEKKEIYLIKEVDKNKIALDKWNLPGGSIEESEGIIKAAKRESLEETGYKVKINSLLGCYQGTKSGKSWLYLVFDTKPVNIKNVSPVGDSSITDGRWFTQDQFLQMKASKMVHPDMKKVFRIANSSKGLKLNTIKSIIYD